MTISKTLLAMLAVVLVAGSGAAAAGVTQTDTGASAAAVSDLEMDATLNAETVTVRMADAGDPVENASLTVEGDEEVPLTTDADGTATINRSALTDGDESLDELKIEYESANAEGELEYVVQEDSLTLVEETYEYEIADDADDDREEAEEREEPTDDDEDAEDEEEDDEEEDDEEEDDEEEDDEEEDDEE